LCKGVSTAHISGKDETMIQYAMFAALMAIIHMLWYIAAPKDEKDGFFVSLHLILGLCMQIIAGILCILSIFIRKAGG